MPKTVLLADDSLTIQRVVTLTFANEDVTITSVSDGDQAVESISRKRPDLVLADIAMPGRSGYQVAEFVRSRPELSTLPVLLLAGAFDHIDEAHVRTVGADGVLTKPFEPKALIGHVKQLLAMGRPEPIAHVAPAASKPVAGIAAAAESSAHHAAPAPMSVEQAFSVLVESPASASAVPTHELIPPAVPAEAVEPASHAEPLTPAAEPEPVPAPPVSDVAVHAESPVEAAAVEPTTPEPAANDTASTEPVVVDVAMAAEPVAVVAAVAVPEPVAVAVVAPVTESPVETPVGVEISPVFPPPITRTPSPDTYFEQIDQAFAALAKAPRPSLNLVPKPPTPSPAVDESRDEVIAAVVETKLASFTAALKAAEAPARTIPLSDAFNALLDAERAGVIDTTVRLSGVPALSPVDVDALATQVMHRVLEQMTDRVVRETVTEIVTNTAERLIREEIEQVKRNIT